MFLECFGDHNLVTNHLIQPNVEKAKRFLTFSELVQVERVFLVYHTLPDLREGILCPPGHPLPLRLLLHSRGVFEYGQECSRRRSRKGCPLQEAKALTISSSAHRREHPLPLRLLLHSWP